MKELRKGMMMLKNSMNYVNNSRILIYLFSIIFVYGLYANFWSITYQPFMLDNGVNIKYFGLLYAVSSFVNVIVSRYSVNIASFLKRKENYFLLIDTIEIMWNVLIFFVFGPIYVILFYIVKNSFNMLVNPLLNSYLQEYIPTEWRSTILSLKNTSSLIGSSLGSLIVGVLLKFLNLRYIVFLSGVLLLFVIAIWMVIKTEKFNKGTKHINS